VDSLIKRRSIRKFLDKSVERELVLKILDIARWAPSAKNAQPWSFVIVFDRETLSRLASLSPSTEPLRNAPVAVAVIGDPIKAPLTYMIDCAVVTTYILLAAYAYGLGSVWINALRYQSAVKEILEVPEQLVPISIVALGWPAETPIPPPRRELLELIYWEKYGRRKYTQKD